MLRDPIAPGVHRTLSVSESLGGSVGGRAPKRRCWESLLEKGPSRTTTVNGNNWLQEAADSLTGNLPQGPAFLEAPGQELSLGYVEMHTASLGAALGEQAGVTVTARVCLGLGALERGTGTCLPMRARIPLEACWVQVSFPQNCCWITTAHCCLFFFFFLPSVPCSQLAASPPCLSSSCTSGPAPGTAQTLPCYVRATPRELHGLLWSDP